MIILSKADCALKSIYLGVMAELLNTRVNPLLTKIQHTTADVWGKEIRTHINGDDEYVQLISTLKNLYAQVTISDKTIQLADRDIGAFINVLNNEVEQKICDTGMNIGRMLYSDGFNPKELTGIGAIFDMAKPLYGQERNTSPVMQPLIKQLNKLNDTAIKQTIDELAKRGANIDYIAVSKDVKYAYIDNQSSFNRVIDIVELDGGFKALSYHGIPLVYDRFIPQGIMYLLDTSTLRIHELCDWRWLESDDGRIFRCDVDNQSYTATIVKYCDLICNRPDKQGMIKFNKGA